MFEILFAILFLVALTFIIIIFGITLRSFITLGRNFANQQAQNQNAPQISREARVIAKRQQVSTMGRMRSDESGMRISTWYYVTFEFPDGSRTEFIVNPGDYGLLVEGDRGTLHSQGTWFRGFDRFPYS